MNGLQGYRHFCQTGKSKGDDWTAQHQRHPTAKPGHALARPGHCLVQKRSDVEAEVHDISVFYDVVLAFHADLAGGLRDGMKS